MSMPCSSAYLFTCCTTEPENVVPNATVTKTDERLPAVSHIDSIKNMVRVKEACVRIDSEAFTPLGKSCHFFFPHLIFLFPHISCILYFVFLLRFPVSW